MTFPEILRGISVLLGLLVSLCYAYQFFYLFLPLLKQRQMEQRPVYHRYAVLIAARNEAAVLPFLLDSLRNQDYPAELYQVFVVADNCTDRTAVVAEEGGAVVFRRHNSQKVGKGYALHFLLDQIDRTCGLDSFDAFLVFDADNLLKCNYISQINRTCSQGYDVFCGYRNTKNFGSSWVSMGHALWYIHESVHLNRSRMLLGNPCMVNGTGFGFTRDLLKKCGGWHFFTLTEDIEFSTWCITHGIRCGYCHEAMVYDEQPVRFSQSWRQRTRWVQGGIQVSVRYGAQLLLGIVRGGPGWYPCLEATTLSLWGYGLGLISGLLAFWAALLSAGWLGLGKTLLLSLVSAVLIPLLIGGMTLATEWRSIRATTAQKFISLLVFPLHVLSYLPIAVTALFRKFSWPPIEHTAACSIHEMQES